MNKIFKYPLEVLSEQVVKMPKGAVILDVQVQNGKPCLWAVVDQYSPTVERTIYTLGTGQEVALRNRKHIATYQLDGGELVYHVFGDTND